MPFKYYRVTSKYGYRTHPISGKKNSFHRGIDLIKGHKSDIHAFIGGEVLYAGVGRTGTGFGGYGNVVLIGDSNGRGNLYAHLDSVSVKTGQKVKKGTIIGKQGTTGNSTGSHLHFEVRAKAEKKIPYGWSANGEKDTLEPVNYVKSYVDKTEVPFTHVVARGDTLSVIAKTYGTSVKALVKKNSIKNPNVIRVGEVLIVGDSNPKKKYTKAMNTVSIVDFLTANGASSTLAHRKKLAKQAGIKNYRGTAKQNTELLNTLKKQ